MTAIPAVPSVPSEPPLTDEAALSDAELASLEALRAATTEEPWAIWPDLKQYGLIAIGNAAGVLETELWTEGEAETVAHVYVEEDADLIVAAVNALPRLVASLRSAREELAQAVSKVEVLMYGDAHMQSRIWLGEECARLKDERDQAQAELAELTVEWGLRKPSGHVDGPYSHESYVQGENARRNSMGQPRRVVRRYVGPWQPIEEGTGRGSV